MRFRLDPSSRSASVQVLLDRYCPAPPFPDRQLAKNALEVAIPFPLEPTA